MAVLNGLNYAKEFVNIPSEQGAIGEMGGRVKCMFDSNPSTSFGDTLNCGKIPAGARILRVSYIGDGAEVAGDFSLAKGDKLSAEAEFILTIPAGQTPATEAMAFCEYTLD